MAENKSFIRRFFGAIWSVVEVLRKAVVLLLLVLVIGGVVLAVRGGPPIKVEKGIALVIVPWGDVVDYADEDPRTAVASYLLGDEPTQTILADLLDAIDAGAADDRIKLLFLKLDTGFRAGQAQLEEIAAAVTRFRETGKKVVAYAPDMGQSEYFLAAHADEIVIDPMGLVFLAGFENYHLYFREALDKLGVQVNVFRVGEYKSAVEPFMRNDMSESARSDASVWLNTLWSEWSRQVATARQVDPELLQAYVDEFADRLEAQGGDTGQLALSSGLVDDLLTLAALRRKVGVEVGMDKAHGSFRQIDHRRYLRALNQATVVGSKQKPGKSIGVVVAQGEIVDGQSEPGVTGGDTLADLVREARNDDNVAALVLRVDSPGGSVYASEVIRRALANFKGAGKPFVVSMASVAASGGYWISMESDRIFAHATTITGSIGVFGLIPTFEKSLAKLGVHSDGVGTTTWSGSLSANRSLSEDARRTVQMIVERDYQRFVDRVAAGRSLEPAAVAELAGGRIWAGSDALRVGLVDELGDLDAAIADAAQRAGLAEGDYSIYPIEPAADIRLELLRRFSQATWFSRSQAGQWLGALLVAARREINKWNDPRGSYANCLCEPQARVYPGAR